MVAQIVGWIVGLILLTASATKFAGIWSGPSSSYLFGHVPGSWVDLALASAEAILAGWIMSRWRPVWSWLLALTAFGLFAAASLAKALAGEPSCGCFGSWELDPRLTFILDIFAIGALTRWPPRTANEPSMATLRRIRKEWWLCVLACQLLIAVSVWFQSNDESAMLAADRVKLGEPLGIGSHIDIRSQLDEGRWLVLFYKNRCAACVEARHDFCELAGRFERHSNRPRVSLVECPPYQPATDPSIAPPVWIQGRLDRSRPWRLPAPFAVLIEDGKVRSIFPDPRDRSLFSLIWSDSASGNPAVATAATSS